VTRKLSRARIVGFFAGIAPSRIGMEACGSAHHWARELRAMGHETVLMAPVYVKPYRKRGKNDANDAAALLARRCRGPICGSFRSRAPTSKPS
jgi:transposase